MSKDIDTILKEFIRHVSDLKAEDDPAGTGFHREFRILREIQTQNKNEDKFPTEDGKREENVKKNRYKDILPRDDKRVKLQEIPGEKGLDYINATYIDDVHGKNGYIAAQGPMPHTVNDFWRMLWEQNTEILFMACRLKEDGRPKCEKYWAENGEHATYGEITVYTESEEEIQEHFLKRELRAEKNGQKHRLLQFHYTGWPDHNTPSSPDALRCMIEEVRKHRKKMNIPMVVHCSAGCGRTGTICGIDYAWTLLDKGMIEEGFSMFEIIKNLREQRMSMVQTPDQYEYTHMVMKSLCDEWLVTFANRDYENVTIGPPPVECEEPVEFYSNIEVNGDSSNNRDSSGSGGNTVVFLPKAGSKESEKLQRNSASEISHKPAIKQSKPDMRQKAQAPSAPPGASRPKTIHLESAREDQAGEYVEVRSTASVPPTMSPTSPPSLPTKKNPPPNTAPLDPTPAESEDPHKTVITLGGGNAQPKIIKSGSVGVSSTKKQAPKPPAAQAVNQQQQQPRVTSDQTHAGVARAPSSRQDPSPANYENSVPTNSKPPAEDGPALPERNYRPEEASRSDKHSYGNVERLPAQPAPQQPRISASSSSSSTSPTSTLTRNQGQTRAPQPLPKSQSPTRSPPVQVHPGVPHPGASQGGQGHMPGMVRAMGGIPAGKVIEGRRGSGRSASSGGGYPTQPISAAHQGGPIVVRTIPALDQAKKFFKRQKGKGGKEQHSSQPVQPPPPGQIRVAKKGKIVYLTERPRRVTGPRPMPSGWVYPSSNHRGTYL